MKKALFYLELCFVIGAIAYVVLRSFRNEQPNPESPAQEETTTKAEALKEAFQEGDLIFQTSLSGQSQAIQLATRSPYSHCGIIFKEEGKFYVFEAIQPVSRTPLERWIARGKQGKYVVKRLKKSDLDTNPKTIMEMKSLAKSFLGRPYDSYFEWSDENMYCSEYIWKIYQQTTGLELGRLQKLGDFDLSHPIVQKKLKQRYGANVPLEEKVISPAAIFESALLESVSL